MWNLTKPRDYLRENRIADMSHEPLRTTLKPYCVASQSGSAPKPLYGCVMSMPPRAEPWQPDRPGMTSISVAIALGDTDRLTADDWTIERAIQS